MYSTPPSVTTEVFAKLPAGLRLGDRPNPVTAILGRKIECFLEGPSFDTAGYLYCVDIPYGRIFRIDPDGHFELFAEYEGQPNGLKIHKDGRIFVADRQRGIVIVDPNSRRVDFMLRGVDLEPFRGPNDLVFSAAGDLYFTDQGSSDLADPTGRVFRLRADGRLEVLLQGLPGPNGIALDSAGKTLYVALTRSNNVIRGLLLPDGRLTRVQAFVQLSGGGGPDGIATDVEGGLIVAHPMMGAVWRFNSRGEPTLRVNLCHGELGTNIAFGGSDRRRLFITESESGTIHYADLPVPGTLMYSHAA